MSEFFAICEYFQITPVEFFSVGVNNPALVNEVLYAIRRLSDDDLKLTLQNINRLLQG